MSPVPGAPSCAASRPLPCRRPPGGRAGRRARRSGGRPLPGRVTSRTPREPWRSYAKNVRAEPGGWHLPGQRRRRRRRPAERARGQTPPPSRPCPRPCHAPTAGGAVTIATGLQAQSAVYSQTSARKFGREAARRTSLGWGGGRGRREG